MRATHPCHCSWASIYGCVRHTPPHCIASGRGPKEEMDCARCYPWPWAIGYTALSALRHARNRVKAVALRATLQSIPVLPASEMMRSVRYPRARTLHFYTAWKPSGTVKEFIDFCLSSRGHALVQKAGYVVMLSTAPCPRSRTRLVLGKSPIVASQYELGQFYTLGDIPFRHCSPGGGDTFLSSKKERLQACEYKPDEALQRIS
jgi:hypothetical protein